MNKTTKIIICAYIITVLVFCLYIENKKPNNFFVKDQTSFSPYFTINPTKDYERLGFQGFTNSDQSFVFLDQGTSHVRSLSIVSLAGEREKNITYIGNSSPIITSNGYLVYQAPSAKYFDAHPEVEVASAFDVHALRLSDFSDSVICAGTQTINCGMSLNKEEQESQKPAFIHESFAKNILLTKTIWSLNDPKSEIIDLPVSGLDNK